MGAPILCGASAACWSFHRPNVLGHWVSWRWPVLVVVPVVSCQASGVSDSTVSAVRLVSAFLGRAASSAAGSISAGSVRSCSTCWRILTSSVLLVASQIKTVGGVASCGSCSTITGVTLARVRGWRCLSLVVYSSRAARIWRSSLVGSVICPFCVVVVMGF